MLQYTIASTALGQALLVQSQQGIRALFFAETEQDLLNALHTLYSGQDCQRQDARLRAVLENIVATWQANQPLDLPLDLQGTDFQKKVWKALLSIPFGEVWTYSQLAAYIGQPSAFRAVASACAKNKLAIIVPCHRVISKNGQLGGYRWGLQRKQLLLQHEQKLLAK